MQQAHPSTKLSKNLKKVRFFVSLLFKTVSFHLFPVSYRACLNVKNIKDAQGKVIKTICSTDFYSNHIINRRTCENFNMNLLQLDTPEVTTDVLAYASDQYMRLLPTHVFTEGSYGNNWCRCISNFRTGIATKFARLICPCSDALFTMCEFKFPRSMLLNWKQN